MAKSPKSTPATPAAAAGAEFPLLAYVDDLVDGLRRLTPAALKEFDEDAIHQARVATRRVKAATDLMAPVLSKGGRKPFATVMRKLRRRLGPLRDLDVMLGHLGDYEKAPKLRAAAGWLGGHLRKKRDEAREAAGKGATTTKTLSRLGTWWGLREEVVEARDAVGPLLAESVHLQLDAFAEQADHVARGSKDEGQAVGNVAAAAKASDSAPDSSFILQPSSLSSASHVDPHEVRIVGKALRYTLEMAVVDGHPLPADVAKAFKRMQEALGLWHDFVVLTETALRASLDAMLALHDPPLQAAVLELARATLQRSARELDKFSAKWRDRGQDLARTIRAAFPLTRSLRESKQESKAAAAAAPKVAPPPGEGPDGPADTDTDPAAVSAPRTGPGPSGSAEPAAPAAPVPGATSAV